MEEKNTVHTEQTTKKENILSLIGVILASIGIVLAVVALILGSGKDSVSGLAGTVGEKVDPGATGDKGDLGETPTISISDDGYWVINGEKTNVKAEVKEPEITNENPQGLDLYLKDDGTYVVSIGKAKYLSKIVIPSTYCGKAVTEIAPYGFSGNSTNEALPLKEIVIPDSVTSIGSSAFKNCSSLTSVVIPDSVTSIGEAAFYDCNSLTSVVIGDGVKSIAYKMFYSCNLLTSVVIPDSVTSIGDYTFSDCDSLTSVVIPDSVMSIGNGAFSCSDSLTSVVIGNGVKSIAYEMFYSCDLLTSVVIPDSVTLVGGYAFNSCSSLTDIYYTGSESEWQAITIRDGNNSLKNVTIHYNYIPEN